VEATEDDCPNGSRPQGGSQINVPKPYVFQPPGANIVPSISDFLPCAARATKKVEERG